MIAPHALSIPRAGYRRTTTGAFGSVLADPILRVLLLAMVFSHLLDLFTTAVALQTTGYEMNPLSAAVIHQFGMGGLLAEKTAVVVFTAYNMGRLTRGWAAGAGVLTTAVTGLAVLWNLQAI